LDAQFARTAANWHARPTPTSKFLQPTNLSCLAGHKPKAHRAPSLGQARTATFTGLPHATRLLRSGDSSRPQSDCAAALKRSVRPVSSGFQLAVDAGQWAGCYGD